MKRVDGRFGVGLGLLLITDLTDLTDGTDEAGLKSLRRANGFVSWGKVHLRGAVMLGCLLTR